MFVCFFGKDVQIFSSSPPFVNLAKLELYIPKFILVWYKIEFTKGIYLRCGRRKEASVWLSVKAVSVDQRQTEAVEAEVALLCSWFSWSPLTGWLHNVAWTSLSQPNCGASWMCSAGQRGWRRIPLLLRLLPDHVACIPPQTLDPKMHANDSVAIPAPSLSLGSWVFCLVGFCIFRYLALSLSFMISGLCLVAKDLLYSTILEKKIFSYFF